MPFELQTAADGVKLVLTGRLGVQQARPLWDTLQSTIAKGRDVRVQAGDLEEMDTSIVQILCRASSQATRIQIGNTSDGFLASLRRRGLEQFFVQPSVSSETPPSAVRRQAIVKTKSRTKRRSRG